MPKDKAEKTWEHLHELVDCFAPDDWNGIGKILEGLLCLRSQPAGKSRPAAMAKAGEQDGSAITTLLTVSELAKDLKISMNGAYRLLASGDIVSAKIGGQWRVRPERVAEYLDRQEKASKPKPDQIL